jgi:microsomal dipeptidase-like Zn-dependent dipeptidase
MTVVGYADLHCHPMAHLGFGGQHGGRGFFWGNPTDAIDQALPCCTKAHDVWQGGGILPRFTEHETPGFDGFDTFQSWPRHTTVIHQQMYLDSVQRAFRAGLKLIVASAVNNELLADLYQGAAVDTRDELSITAQLQGMRAFAAQCADWMQIVTTPAEARAVMEAGKLAVVLAIEVDSIGGGPMRKDGQLDPNVARAIVQKWWNDGVRLINPIHLVDNALGGTCVSDDRFNLSNHYLFRKWAAKQPEPWFFDVEAGAGDLADVRFLLGGNQENVLLIQLYNQSYPTYIKTVGRGGHANRRGLSAGGAAFVQAMMDQGMLIDVEHMSSHTLDATLLLAEARGYPLISSHTGVRALAVPRPDSVFYVRGCATEAMRSERQLRALKALGSLVGIGGHVGQVAGLSIDSSAGWARAYRYVRDTIGFDSIAIGTDMNGFAQAPGPRFVADAAAPGGLRHLDAHDAVRPIKYGQDLVPVVRQVLEQTALGKKKFSYNTEGLAHYGLLPDFTLDLALSLGGEESLGAFFNSAEAFVAVWEKCATP